MTLKDEIKGIRAKKRRFFLFRIADVDAETARNLCKVPLGTYHSWLKDIEFRDLYRRRDEFAANYKLEAISLLRRDTQIAAILLEEEIIKKMANEVKTGRYNIIKTHLAREVYAKIIGELDQPIPTPQSVTWEQKIANLFLEPAPRGGNSDAKLIEATNSQTEQSQEGEPIPQGKQGNTEVQEAM